MNKQSLDDRLRRYLVQGADEAIPTDLETRVLARSTDRPASPRRWILQTLAATAFVVSVAAIALGVHFSRSVRPPVTPAATPSPAASQRTITMESIDLKTVRSGWALAYEMPAGNSGTQRRLILRTTDGGRHWRDVTPPGSWQPAAAWFLDDSAAWAVSIREPGRVSIMSTTDTGAHWRESTILDQQAQEPASLDFLDPARGWMFVSYGAAAGSEGGAVYQTLDGGLQWTRIAVTNPSNAPGQLPFGGDKNGVAFINPSTGWLLVSSAGPAPLLYVSHDGGRSWQRQTLTVPAGADVAGAGVTVPRFFSATTGEFEIEGNRTVVYVTVDGGATWTPRLAPALGKAFFLNESIGWLVSHDGNVVYSSTDGGTTWSGHRPDRSLSQLYALDFVTSTTGYAILASDSGHMVIVTSDGGLTWNALTPSVP